MNACRPHGQHYVVLAEDAGRYKELMSRGERGGDMGSSSHQVYLTFPSESTFMEEDVANYFGYVLARMHIHTYIHTYIAIS